jgi:flavin-dependent dehydrogenase
MRASQTNSVDVAVLGTGPAGIVAARDLRKLGRSVMLLGESRSTAVEGLSGRTHGLLNTLGLDAAARSVRSVGRRHGTWAGAKVALGKEYIVDRAEFDRALLIDAAACETLVRPDLVTQVDRAGVRWRVFTRTGAIECRAVVDARGRRNGRAVQRGKSLIALSQALEGIDAGPPETAIYPTDNGWCWFATDGRGSGSLQLVTLSPGLGSFRSELTHRVLACLPGLIAMVPECKSAVPVGPTRARAATARRLSAADEPGYVRAGDAAVACDPLSGHGLYEAMRSAAIAAAAVHTYLERDSWEVAARFADEAAQDRWNTAITAASGFYLQQAICTPTRFWTQLAQSYSSLRAEDSDAVAPGVELRPVLNGSLIEMRRVVVTPQRPRGVWQVDTVDLARLIEFFGHEPSADAERASQAFAHHPTAVTNAMRWLATNGLLRGYGP